MARERSDFEMTSKKNRWENKEKTRFFLTWKGPKRANALDFSINFFANPPAGTEFAFTSCLFLSEPMPAMHAQLPGSCIGHAISGSLEGHDEGEGN